MQRLTKLSMLLVLVLAAAGCGFGDSAGERLMEEVAGEAADEDVDLDMDEDGITIETEDGEVSMDEDGFSATGEDGEFEAGAGGELPDDFPDEMPVPDGEIQLASSGSDADGQQLQVTIVAEDDLEALEALYADELEAGGWDVEEEAEMSMDGMRSRVLAAEGHGWDGSVTLTQTDDEPPLVNIVLTSS